MAPAPRPAPERRGKTSEEAHQDNVFGVPIFVLRDELFWGHDRIPLLEERLTEYALANPAP